MLRSAGILLIYGKGKRDAWFVMGNFFPSGYLKHTTIIHYLRSNAKSYNGPSMMFLFVGNLYC